MVGIVDGAVVLLYVRHQIGGEVVAEHVTHAHHALWRCGQEFGGIAVGQHHNHLFCIAFSQEVVENVVHAAYLVIHFLGIGGAADEVEDRILLLLVSLLVVGWWQIDDGIVGAFQALGIAPIFMRIWLMKIISVFERATVAVNLRKA